jgi:hypothetical protein
MGSEAYESWPHKWFGIFQADDGTEEGVPRFSEFVDVGWQPGDKLRIVEYLKSAPNVLSSSSLPTPCMICGAELGDPGSFFSDGEWLWPERLVHYMIEHDVRLPDEFVERIRKAEYKVSYEFDGDISSLPWPDV